MVKKMKDARLGLQQQDVKEAVEGFRLTNGQGQGNVVQPQTETSEAMPQSTNTTSEAQSATGGVDANNADKTLTSGETPSEKKDTPVVATPTEEKSGADYLDSLYEELKPISKEEEERRLRGAASANTVAHLGNLLGALGGLYYTTKGAPAQEVADIKTPDYDAFSNRVRKQREAHAGRLRDFDKWKQQMRIAEEELALKKEDAALKREAQELDRQYKQGLINKNELERRILALQEKFAPEKHEAELGRINAQTGSYNSSAYASRERGNYYSRGGSGSGSKNQPYEFSIDGKTYTVSKNRWNDANKSELLRLAGSDGYVEYEDGSRLNPETGEIESVKKRRSMTDNEAVSYVINHMNDKTRKYLESLGSESENPKDKKESPTATQKKKSPTA
jgi:hypothetical protein